LHFLFQKRNQHFVSVHKETLPVALGFIAKKQGNKLRGARIHGDRPWRGVT
jgi:hypothetical protein